MGDKDYKAFILFDGNGNFYSSELGVISDSRNATRYDKIGDAMRTAALINKGMDLKDNPFRVMGL